MSESYEISGLEGLWHHVTTRNYDAMLKMLGKANGPLTERAAKDFMEAGDGEFTAINPRTLKTERYATVFGINENGYVSLFRKEE